MYRRPKFLETLLEIRRQMALDVDYDVDLFAEVARSGNRASKRKPRPAERLNQKPAVEAENIRKLIRSFDR